MSVFLFFLLSGIINTSPLRLELEFEPVLTETTWYLCCTYVYNARINFTGSSSKQDVTVELI